ncbi:MAG: sulfite exporter TauE/SafE family protein [Bryobacteraceae bacterium]|nr:sulfite exporter TauE/SafE family protein [Bryobacteraceae bacterium]
MLEPLAQWTLLSAAAAVAGAVNSIAGGGTLFTFSTLLVFQGPIAANATSTFTLLPASLAASWGYRRELAECRAHLWRLGPPSLLGGIIGSLLVARLPERIFSNLVPWLLLGATLLLLIQPWVSRRIGALTREKPTPRTVAAIVFFQLLVGIYGGYFGAGIGILMLSSLALAGIPNIHQMNAVKSLLAGMINATTVVVFILSGVIVWKYAIAMALVATAAGYLGARWARKLKASVVRAIVVTIGFGLAAYSFFSR